MHHSTKPVTFYETTTFPQAGLTLLFSIIVRSVIYVTEKVDLDPGSFTSRVCQGQRNGYGVLQFLLKPSLQKYTYKKHYWEKIWQQTEINSLAEAIFSFQQCLC